MTRHSLLSVFALSLGCGFFQWATNDARAADRSVSDAAAAPMLGRLSDEALQRAFRGDEFWWKRAAKVEDPDAPLLVTFFRWLGDVIGGAIDALGRILESVIKWLLRGIGLGGLGEEVDVRGIAWLVIGCAVAFTLWKLRRLLLSWLKWDRSPQTTSPAAFHESLPEAVVLLEQSAAALRAGKYRDAVRLAFLALLAALQHRRLLRYDASRTNREYYRDLRAAPELARMFLEAARPFERAWYGQREVAKAEAEHVLSLCQRAIERQGDRE